MNIIEFSQFLKQIEENNSRNYKIEVLSKLLLNLKESELPASIYMLDGRIGPRYLPLVYNYSIKLMIRTLDKLAGETISQKLYHSLGDIGLAASKIREELMVNKKDLNINEVYDALTEIALKKGKGSQEAKINKMAELFLSLDVLSIKYVSRIIVGNLRLGLNYRTVLDAISFAIKGDKSLRGILDRAYGIRSDLGTITSIAMFSDIKSLKRIKLQVGVPLASKLVEREKSAEAIYKRLGEHIIQPKYDGLRAQIHLDKKGFKKILSISKQNKNDQKILDIADEDMVAIYSRNMDNITEMFPDIVRKVTTLNVESLVLDSEVIGYNPKTEKFVPFQETIQRKRKYDVGGKVTSIPVKVKIFDLLCFNGNDLTLEPLQVRLEKLQKIIPSHDCMLEVSESIKVSSIDEMKKYFNKYIKVGLEGLISKKKDSIYKPGTRDFDWIKLKASASSEFVDTIDAVILGYYLGRGARAKFGIGALLVGVYDKEKDEFVSVAKIGTGIKDEEWREYKKALDQIEVKDKPDSVVVDRVLYPDVWVRPEIVSVIDADQITRSKHHTAGRSNKTGYGYSLRFPRMKQFKRDKQATDATTVKELIEMYELAR